MLLLILLFKNKPSQNTKKSIKKENICLNILTKIKQKGNFLKLKNDVDF